LDRPVKIDTSRDMLVKARVTESRSGNLNCKIGFGSPTVRDIECASAEQLQYTVLPVFEFSAFIVEFLTLYNSPTQV